MVEKRPARIWWRKHRDVENRLAALALVTEGFGGQLDIFIYRPASARITRVAEETIQGSPGEAQERADALVIELLRHRCAGCDRWV